MKVLCRTVREGPAVVPVDGLPCGVPGLAITRAPETIGYTITHVRSGCAVLWFPDTDPEGVLAAAFELGQVADWTLTGADLAALRIGRHVHAIGRSYGAHIYSISRKTDAEDIQ